MVTQIFELGNLKTSTSELNLLLLANNIISLFSNILIEI